MLYHNNRTMEIVDRELILDTLIQRRNKLQRNGKYTDPVDEVIIRLGKAKHIRIRS